MLRTILPVIVILAALATAKVGDKAPNFDLNDQFAKNHTLSSLRGNVSVIVCADSDSGRMMGPWVDGLKEKYGSKIKLYGLLDLHSVPGIGRGIAKRRIRNETTDTMLLDFRGDIAKAYQVSSKSPVVVVIDKQLIVKDIEPAYSKTAFDNASSAIDKALAVK